jgi:hypothetical protein
LRKEVEDAARFEEWISYVFDRPADRGTWSYSHSRMSIENSAQTVAFLTRVFEEAHRLLTSFSDEQVAQGLAYLIGQDSEYVFAIQEPLVPLPDRLHCIEAMVTLFERCFAPRCSAYLGFAAVKPLLEEVNPLNPVCQYWWDDTPLQNLARNSPEIPDAEALDDAVLKAILRILTFDSVACQESALLGLHCRTFACPELNMMVDAFIDSHPDLWGRICPDIRSEFFGRPWVPVPFVR